jgi:hypothetical protein
MQTLAEKAHVHRNTIVVRRMPKASSTIYVKRCV